MISRCRCSPAITSPTTPAPASCTPRRVTAARTSRSGRRMRAKLEARGINTTIPYTVDADGRFTDHAPGFTGKRVLTDKGEKGDANEAVIKALIDGRHADRARPPQAPISAFLALEEAGDLPQHAAMVHRDGQADRPGSSGRRQRRAAATRCASARSKRSKSPAGCRSKGRTASPAWSRASPTG